MGVSGKRDTCATCGEQLQTCNGHFGHVRLVLPAFHVGYFKKIIQILQSICKACTLASEALDQNTNFVRTVPASSCQKPTAGNS